MHSSEHEAASAGINSVLQQIQTYLSEQKGTHHGDRKIILIYLTSEKVVKGLPMWLTL